MLTRLIFWRLLALVAVSAGERIVYTRPRTADCGMGCNDAIGLVKFGDYNTSLDYYPMHAASNLYLTSMAACLNAYCSPDLQIAAWDQLTEYAKLYGEVDLSPLEAVKGLILNTTLVDVLDTANQEIIWNSTILPTRSNWYAGFRTERTWDMQMIYHHAYGWALYLLLAVMVLIGIFNRGWAALVNSQYGQRLDPEAVSPQTLPPGHQRSVISRLHTWYKSKIAVPAFFGYRHLQPWSFLSIPTRLQGILIFIYFALNFIWSCTNYELFYDNLYWYGDKKVQLARYIADRTGIMAFYNLPLLWLLAGRNNVLMWITGWNYTSCNLFHRWVARVATLQAIVHSIAYTWLERDYLAEEFKERYWACGVAATAAMSLLLPLSIRPLREKLYEFFLLLHIAMALSTLVLLFYHVDIFEGSYNGYLWACVAIWLFDRVLRFVRVAVLSTRPGKNTVACITQDANLLRLSVRTLSFTPKPGSYYFLYTPWSLTPWENHPFTLASWDCGDDSTTLHFVIKVAGGATRKMKKRIAALDTNKINMTVLLEGPYGTSHPVEAYDHVLMVAGGSGITAMLPYVFRLVDHGRDFTVVWAVKNLTFASTVLEKELSHANLGRGKLIIHLSHDSTPSTPATPDSPGTTPSVEATKYNNDNAVLEKLKDNDQAKIAYKPGRPAVAAILQDAVDVVRGGRQRLAILACGPWQMMDDMRQAVANCYDKDVTGAQVEYFEEAFMW